MISRIVTDYLRDLARRMENGLVNCHEWPPKIYDMADVTQLRDLAETLDDERGQDAVSGEI